MSARFRCSSVDKMKPAASPGFLGVGTFYLGWGFLNLGSCVGVRFYSMDLLGVFHI